MRNFIDRQLFIRVLALSLALSFFGAPLAALAQQQRGAVNSSTVPTPNAADSSHPLRDDTAAYHAEVETRLAAQQRTINRGPEETTLTPPANDNFVNGILLAGASGGIFGTNVEATGESGEPNHAGISSPLNSVWYTWTAPSNLSMTFHTTAGTLTDTTMAVYTGSAVSALTLIAQNDEIGINAGTGTPSRVTFIANAGTVYRIAVDSFSSLTGTFSLFYGINAAETYKQFNYNGDIISDVGVFRPSNTTWYIRISLSGEVVAATFGLSADNLHAGDFDGDGKTDIAVWRRSIGVFYVLQSSDGTLRAEQWGQEGDVPVQGDYDGDDKSDFAVWRPSNGTFYVLRSSDRSLLAEQWGQSGDFVAPGDYDGDGKTDFAVQRPTPGGTAIFYVHRSSDGGVIGESFGLNTDVTTPGDYDNDGKTDIAVYRQSNNVFYARRSSDGGFIGVAWGTAGDLPAPADYSGDFATDMTVFRPSDGRFYIRPSGSESLLVIPWGQNLDKPVATSNVH